MKKYLLSILTLQIITLIVILGGRAYAATSYKVHGDEPMTLKNSISATQTTSIVLVGPWRNRVRQTFTTQSGGILEFASSNREYVELVYYSSATVASNSTKDVTLAGVVRGYCWNNATDSQTFASCEAGRIWAKGTRVTLVNDMRLFNMAAKRDLANTFTGSGKITSNQTSQANLRLTNVTTTEIGNFTVAEKGDVVWDETLGVTKVYDGASWLTLSQTGTTLQNIGYGSRGVAELTTPTETFNRTASGSSNAGLVVANKDVVTGSGQVASQLATANVVATSGATIHPSLTGSGARTGSKFLRDDGTWQTDRIGSGTNLIVDALYNAADITNVTSATFAQIHADLQKSATITSGDLLEFIATIPYVGGSTPCNDFHIDFQVGGGNITGTSQGVAGDFCSTGKGHMTAHYFHRTTTGGTVNMQPLYRINANQVSMYCTYNCRFQVIKHE